MVAPRWSVKVEYLYVDYGSFEVGAVRVRVPVTYLTRECSPPKLRNDTGKKLAI